MAEKAEEVGVTQAPATPVETPHPVAYEEVPVAELTLPPGKKYKQFRIFGKKIPWYASPKIQLGMVAFVCFLCPGMFNALGGMGGGGKADATLADNMVRLLFFSSFHMGTLADLVTEYCSL